jgi:hypothetical protein
MIKLKSLLKENIDDAAYMEAVKINDLESAKKIVEIAAKRNGYNIGPVYHGTMNKFVKFDLDKNSAGRYGNGIYFYGNKELASLHNLRGGSIVVAAYIKLSKPIIPKLENGYLNWGRQQANELYGDGVIVPNYRKGDEIYVVFSPNQVKLEDVITKDNNGNIIPLSNRFDESTDDMRF